MTSINVHAASFDRALPDRNADQSVPDRLPPVDRHASAGHRSRQANHGTRCQPLSTGDKSAIYDWIRQAASSNRAAQLIATAIRTAAYRSNRPEDFDELMIGAMLTEVGS